MSAGRLRTQNGSEFVSDWHVNHSPAANTKATATQSAVSRSVPLDGNTRNVLTGLTVSVAGQGSAPVAGQVTVAVIDGDSGGTTYLWGPMPISIPAVAGAMNGYVVVPLFEVGTAYTTMTIEFSAASGANTIQGVWMTGTTI